MSGGGSERQSLAGGGDFSMLEQDFAMGHQPLRAGVVALGLVSR